MAELLPRVLIAPVLLGGVVLPLTELAMVSHRLRTPFLLILVGLSAFLLYQFDRFHDVRIATSPPDVTARAVGDSRQVALSEAVARWRAANLCPNPTDRCPRPILIAGAGGASRAAFLTATVVGALIDVGNDSTGRARYDNVRNRIFAMSTVSGSSLGGIVVRAALADAAESDDPTLPPCSKATSQRAWFRAIALPNEQRETSNPTRSWRDCFQLLLAGDFLSPVLVGLVYRDLFPIGWPDTGAAWSDRAALLEQAFERRYHAVTRGEEPATCGTADAKGLCRRFGWHPNPDRARAWLPLLFINGTSVSTGRRIVASDIAMGDQYDSANQEKVLMPFAYDINEFGRMPREGEADPKQRAQVQSTAPGPEKVIDILMSTAVTISARFPLISPHGNFRDRLENLRDKVVDGGYFENDGLATVGDVAAVLRYHFGLDPVVIRVLNEPTKAEKAERPRKDRPPIPDEDERTPFDGVTSIFRALTATRSGHEDGHEAYLKSVLGADATTVRSAVNGKHRLYEVRVYELEPEQQLRRNIKQMQLPERNPLCRRADIQSHVRMDHVSMSWWMSHPVQAYLDAQLCVEANWKRLECELIEGRAGHGGTCEAID
jgi:hypothetical protein